MVTPQSTQFAITEAFKAINKSITVLKMSVDKSLADLKSSVNQVNTNMASLTSTFQDFEARVDVTEVRVGKEEFQITANYKDITKQELETSAKTLRLKDEVV